MILQSIVSIVLMGPKYPCQLPKKPPKPLNKIEQINVANKQAVIKSIRDGSGEFEDVVSRSGLSKVTVRRHLLDLIGLEQIKQVTRGSRTKMARYEIKGKR